MTAATSPTPGGPGGRLRLSMPPSSLPVRLFAVGLAILLAGYVFMGRGFAHLGLGPIYVGDWVLLLGLATAAFVVVRERARIRLSLTTGLLVAFMALGLLRTVPYVGTYGWDALRDGVLWGYGIFALLVVWLFGSRPWLELAARAYAWLVPVFAAWLPISWLLFVAEAAQIDPNRPGAYVPLVFFKAGDMAVHAVGAIALLVLAPGAIWLTRSIVSRFVLSIPLTWTVYATGSASRGAMLAAGAGLGATVVAQRHPSRWAPVLAAAIVVVIGLSVPGIIAGLAGPGPGQSAGPGSPTPSPGASSASPSPGTSPLASGATIQPTPDTRRQASPAQWVQNVLSILGASSNSSMNGTRGFRLDWWGKIVDYTVFGPYFWTGKGFGINLADADGFQPTADHSLRAPHNSHMSVLARMGVPGLVLWVLFQGAFAIGLLRAVLAVRRDDRLLAGVGAWVLIVWAAMMVVTSFDPYLEGPQGGIWFWVVVGVGLVVTKLARSPRPASTDAHA